ncbi:hypothetical protein BGZ99_000139 [Dissophora globulifera]|uniref:Uncharacterized protein n=1 Tax=Dissophora globulifera TaxID=979702 RepID=A0A9P6R1Z0_9FUNG|nr:hypothetical protein BGZ99_000139 [Dissophora globulifera]
MELIAVNCTRLKSLNLSSTNVTAETLKVLLHSDPYKTSPNSTDEPDDNDSVDPKTRMEQYRSMTETETDQDANHNLYESVGLPASSTESEQEQHHHQPTGPILAPGPRFTSGRVKLITPGRYTGSQGGTTRPAKFKGTKTQFPFHLEELTFDNCRHMSGRTLFPVLALLGPQLRDLSVEHIADIKNPADFIQFLKHCINLTRLDLAGTEADDKFLAALTGTTKELAPRAMELLDLRMTRVNSDNLVPLIKVSRDKLEHLTFPVNASIKNDAIYAFIEDAKNLSKAPRPVRSFVRNDVLSVLNLKKSINIGPEVLLDLFRNTTALTMVELDGLEVHDDALEALAAANRNRMERLGLGIPEAWIQHEQGTANYMAKQQKGAKQPPAPAAPVDRRLYDGAWVPGGLQALSLKKCIDVTNQGVRAIVRSCPMLWGLNLGDCFSVSMRVFRGPWVCNKLQDLDITGVNMRLQFITKSMQQEEEIEDERFPLTRLLKTQPSDDFRDDGCYDYIAPPMMAGGKSKSSNSEIVDEDGPVKEDKRSPMNPRKNLYPGKAYRNDGVTRRTLNEFYRKLGQFDQLICLNMGMSDYRIRIQDGLDLVLPALTKSLRQWNMYRPLGHTFQNVELKWLGKHFGYGFDYSTDKDELKRQRKIKEEYQRSDDEDDDEEVDEFYDENEEPSGKDLNRVSKLEVLQVCKFSVEQDNLDGDLYEWFMESGFDVQLLDDSDMMWDEDMGLDMDDFF